MFHNKLIFDPRQAHSHALATLRKESLDIYNRLHSIQEDIGFVSQVHSHYPDLPLIPNLRCGAWYIDPDFANETPAYFKSTDGHTGNWGFNLRRANLHLLPIISGRTGIVLVDSTRAGKRMPDALSKTVPIWCAVVNRAILIRRQQHDCETSRWDIELYTPPGVVSAQEHHQIATKLDDWAKVLASSSFEIPLDLPIPLRPFWITPSTTSFPVFDLSLRSSAFLPVICVSASKQIESGTERRAAGYSYVQGSGDDHELWGMGLTPQFFWKYRTDLIASPRAGLEDLIKKILSSKSVPRPEQNPSLTPIRKVHGLIQLGSISPSNLDLLQSSLYSKASESASTAYILLDFSPLSSICDESVTSPCTADAQNILRVFVSPKGKARQDTHFLHHVLQVTIPFIETRLCSGKTEAICILEGCGDDPGTRLDTSVGLAVVAIQLFFDESGALLADGQKKQVDKKSIRTRLEWVIESEPRANPSRATLKRVNEFLLTPPVFLTHSKSP